MPYYSANNLAITFSLDEDGVFELVMVQLEPSTQVRLSPSNFHISTLRCELTFPFSNQKAWEFYWASCDGHIAVKYSRSDVGPETEAVEHNMQYLLLHAMVPATDEN